MSTGNPWRCPPWCRGNHDAGRHSRLIDSLPLMANPAAPELLAVALVERLGGGPRVEIIRDDGTGLTILGLSPDEAIRVHRMTSEALILLGRLPASTR